MQGAPLKISRSQLYHRMCYLCSHVRGSPVPLVAGRSRQGASRWWFLLHSLVDGYVTDETPTPTPTPELVDTLKRFVEEAPLGEFEARLEMLFAFHCHVAMLSPSPRTGTTAMRLVKTGYQMPFMSVFHSSVAKIVGLHLEFSTQFQLGFLNTSAKVGKTLT